MTLSLERINRAREAGYDDDQIVESIARRDAEFGSRILKAKESGHNSTAILQSIEKRLNTPEQQDNTPSIQQDVNTSSRPKIPESSPKNEPTKDKGFWDWVMQDPGPDKYEEMIRPREISREELKKMSVADRYEYAQDLNRHREYMQSKGTTKGLISGVTFGLSEKIPALKPQEGEHGDLFGEFLGSILPIEGLAKVISWPLLKLAGSSPVYKKGLEAFARITGMGVTGATYEGIKEGFKTGELPSAEDVVKHGAAWAALETALYGAGYLGRFISKMRKAGGSTTQKVNELVSKINLEETNPEVLKAQLDKGIKEVFPEKKEGIEVIGSMGSAISDNFYRDTFKALQEGKTSLSGGKDEFMEAAKTSFDKGLIKSKDDLRSFRKVWDEKFNKKVSEKSELPVEKTKSEANQKTETPKEKIKQSDKKEEKKTQKSNIRFREIQTPNSAKLIITRPSQKLNVNNKKPKYYDPLSKLYIVKEGSKNYGYIRIKNLEGSPSHKEHIDVKIKLTNSEIEKYNDINNIYKSSNKLKKDKDVKKKNLDSLSEEVNNRIQKEIQSGKPLIPHNEVVYEYDPQSVVDGRPKKTNKLYSPSGVIGDYIKDPEVRKQLENVLDYPVRTAEKIVSDRNPEAFASYSRGKPITIYSNHPDFAKLKGGKTQAVLEEAIHLLQDTKQRINWVDPKNEYKSIPYEITAKKFVKWASEKERQNRLQNKPKGLVIRKNQNLSNKKISTEKSPITEQTGQGANERLEEPPSALNKIKDRSSEVLEAIKNPNELWNQVYTKTFDALEPLNRLESDIHFEERVTTKIKQAQSAASDINNILTQGVFDNVSNTFSGPSLKDAYAGMGEVWQKASKGLKDSDYSIRDMDIYRTSKEALKRQKRGLKSGIDTEIAERDVARLRQKYGPIDQRLREFQKNTLNHYGKDLLGENVIAQWTQDSHSSLYRVMDYGNDAIVAEGSLAPKKPWYKAKGSTRKIIPPSESDIQNLSMLVSNAKKNDSILQYKKLVEQGKLPGNVVKSKNRAVPEKMLEDLGIDPENEALAETLYNQSRKDSFTPETGRLRGWENGKPFEIEVPRDVYETYVSLAPSDTGMLTKIFKSTNNMMSKGIVLEPIKFGSIFLRDAYSSLIYSKTGSNPISIMKALVDIYKDSHSWNQFKSLGGEQYASRLMTRLDRVSKIEELLKSERPNAVIVPFKKLSSFLKKHSQNLVASVPFAEYQRAVKKFGDTPGGRLQALIEAKSVTYDPTKKGSSKLVKKAANFFPFFNVMLQEPALIAKNMKRSMFWAKGAVGITLPSLLLKMYNDGNPDYDDMNPILKASCWHFYTSYGHFSMPIPWLLGALFKSTPEVFYDMVKGEGGDAWKGLYSYVASQLSGSFPPIVQAAVEQSTGQSLPSPTGLLLMPFADVEKRAPPVVPKRLENLPPEQQYTSKTSQLARWYGKMWGASPIKVERLIKTFGGGLASDALALIDEMVYASGLAEDLRPVQGAKNYLIFGKFLSENTSSNTKYVNEFYKLLEESKIEHKRGRPNNHKQLNKDNAAISKKLRAYRDVEENSTLNPLVKKQQLEAIRKEVNALYKKSVLRNRK